VLAMQGDFERHIEMIRRAGADAFPARLPADFEAADAIILPGGESTTMSKMIVRYGVQDAIIKAHREGKPIYGTCAGMILLAKHISSGTEERGGQYKLALLDITVTRNAFGRQLDSFETDLEMPEITGSDAPPIHAIFIRAPIVESVGEGVDVLCRHGDKIVFVKQGNIIASSFHPELTNDLRVHEYFLSLARASARAH